MRTRRLTSSSDPVPGISERSEGHRTVLLHEAIDLLAIEPTDTVVDATLGGAGHAREIAGRLGSGGTFIGIDLDEAAHARAKDALAEFTQPQVSLVRENFKHLDVILEKLGIANIDKALFDLGWSGYQLSSGRGFSFLADEPLLMTYASNPQQGDLTAKTIVNEWAEDSLADIIFGWGEEKYARRIAKRIVDDRAKKPFSTSMELAESVRAAVPAFYRFGRLHPATKTFQALRIAVNDEMGALKDGLSTAFAHLRPQGRLAVITFHSIEDRQVKSLFLEWERLNQGGRLSKRVIKPSDTEIEKNPRARSAKLRVIEKKSTYAQENKNTGERTRL